MPLHDISSVPGESSSTWNPATTGISSIAGSVFSYVRIGQLVVCLYNVTATASGGSIGITLPVTAQNAEAVWGRAAAAVDGDGTEKPNAFISSVGAADTSHAILYRDLSDTSWVSGAAWDVAFPFFYLAA